MIHENMLERTRGMEYEPLDEGGNCPEGYSRIGCCKCILSSQADSHHMAKDHEPESEPFKIHGAPKEPRKDRKRRKESKDDEDTEDEDEKKK